jgi:lysophospholipase L1-like esterase
MGAQTVQDKPKDVAAEKLDRNMQVAPAPGLADLAWHCPKATPFHLAGFAWFAADRLYRRMPVHPPEPIPPAVDQLANATAGGQIRFRTDSTKVAVRVRLAGPANMAHMPATGQCGFDIYLGDPGRQVYYYTGKFDRTLQSYEVLLADLERGPVYSITLNFPLYQGVEKVEVGLEPGAQVLPPLPYASDRRVIIYGTSITQGGCASRPGMCYSNILSRRINLEFINLGFSGNGKGEPQVARTIATIPNPALFVLDHEANCSDHDQLGRTLPEFIRILRQAHPAVPILAVSRIPFSTEVWHPKAVEKRLANRDLQRRTIEGLRAAGDANVHFLDGSVLLGADNWEECTVDSVHPNDLGFLRIAEGLAPVLKHILDM